MLDYLKILFCSRYGYLKLIKNAIDDDNNSFLIKLINNKQFNSLYQSDFDDIMYKLIRYNNIKIINLLVDTRPLFFNKSANTSYINHTIENSNIEIFTLLFSKLNLDTYRLQMIFQTSVRYYKSSDNNKEIFNIIYEKAHDISYDNYFIIKIAIYYNVIEVFDIFLNNDHLVNCENVERLYGVLSYIIQNNYIIPFKKIIDKLNINLSLNKNELLKLSLNNPNDQISLLLLDDKNVINKKNISSLNNVILMCIEYHCYNNDKTKIINKILDLDFINVSYDNNVFLIRSLTYTKTDIIELLLNNKRLDLSKHDNMFTIINDVDSKTIKKLMNIGVFRKYMTNYTKNKLKPKYNKQKINRTLNE